MNPNFQPTTPKIAAIDLDGTLLGPDTKISLENRIAVTRLAEAGYEVVLASGRHYHSMRGYARELPEVKWMVSSQGAEVGTPDRSIVLGRHFLQESEVDALMHAEVARGFSAVYYSSDDVFTASDLNEHLEHYAAISGNTPVRAERPQIQAMPLQKILWLGLSPHITALRNDDHIAAFGLQGVQTERSVFEFMPVETTKARALQILANHLGVQAENVVAFGDGENDIPIFEWAGQSFAMPHGWENALAKATRIAPPGPPETALSGAVDLLLSGR